MADKSFRGYLVSVILASLFIVSFYGFALGVGNSYDKDLSIDDNKIPLSSLEASLNETSANAQSWEQQTQSDSPFVSTGALILKGLWDIMTSMWQSVGVMFNLFLGSATNVLGIPPMVTGTILALFIMGLIFASWRVIKGGD